MRLIRDFSNQSGAQKIILLFFGCIGQFDVSQRAIVAMIAIRE